MRGVNGVWEKLGERGGRESEGQILREIFNYGVPGENRKVYKVFSRLSVDKDIIEDQLGEAIERFQLGRKEYQHPPPCISLNWMFPSRIANETDFAHWTYKSGSLRFVTQYETISDWTEER